MGVPLETLARYSHPIALAWWFCFLGGPAWLVIAARAVRRRRSHDLRWVVDMKETP